MKWPEHDIEALAVYWITYFCLLAVAVFIGVFAPQDEKEPK